MARRSCCSARRRPDHPSHRAEGAVRCASKEHGGRPPRDGSVRQPGRGERGARGQSLVEFVIVLPVLLVILAGLLDLGRLYYAYVAVTDVAGEAVAYAAAFLPSTGGRCDLSMTCTYDDLMNDGDPATEPEPSDRRELGCACRRAYAATSGLVQGDQLGIMITVPSGTAFGSEITATVRYTHTLVTPLLNAMVPEGTLPLTARATERVVDPSTE